MSNIISKIRQRVALKDKSKFNLSCDHITTTDFLRISPVYFKEMVPGENIEINVSTFTRLSPLVNPMYGRCRIVNRAFFVPMRTIFRGWNEFITDVPYDGTLYLKVPLIDPKDLSAALNSYSSVTASTNAYDFMYFSGSSTSTYKKFNPTGKRIWSLLQSLGYRYSIGYYLNYNAPESTPDSQKMSALPLIAFCKIWLDWYKPQAYQELDGTINALFHLSADNTTTDAPTVSQTVLEEILAACSVATYDKDYFTSAWDRPVAPNSGLNSANTIVDASNDATSTGAYYTAVKNLTTAGSQAPTSPRLSVANKDGSFVNNNSINITQYCIDALKSLTDYLKRHQLAGGLAMDRMMARFGMKPSDAALNRSVYIGKDTVDVQIADVMATANGSTTIGSNTVKSVTGDYAGKGVGFGKGIFKYDTNEYGYLVIISTLIPSVGYVQGINRFNLHKDRLDFFTPEFDSLGVQAIARKELLNSYNGSGETNLINLTPAVATEGIFGYTSRYAEYKCAKDNLTGDFTVPSLASDSATSGGSVDDNWHLFRLFDPSRVSQGAASVTHNRDFVVATDAAQYDRVFAIEGLNSAGEVTFDHFINIYHFEITDYAPMSQLFDDYQFDGGNKQVSIEINGTQLN